MNTTCVLQPNQSRADDHGTWHNEPKLVVIEHFGNDRKANKLEHPTDCIDAGIALLEYREEKENKSQSFFRLLLNK